MPAIRCSKCRAAATIRRDGDALSVTHGSDFMAKCRFFADRTGVDFVAVATECPDMQKAVQRAAWRVRPPSAAAAAQAAEPEPEEAGAAAPDAPPMPVQEGLT
jgi:phage gp29-like protein